MAKPVRQTVGPETDQVEQTRKRNPDYTVLLRQQPQRGGDGRLYRRDNMTIVGAAWKSEKLDEKTGGLVEYIDVNAHIKFEVGDERLLLRTYKEKV